MPRTVRDARLESRAARERLAIRKEPYWRAIAEGWHLGYYKGKREGTWVARFRPPGGTYEKKRLGRADDIEDANGTTILDYKQAQENAREWFREREQEAVGYDAEDKGPYTVRQAAVDYLEWFRGEKKSIRETEYAVNAFILPELGDFEVGKLTSQDIRTWHRRIANTPPRLRTRRGAEQKYRRLDDDDPETSRRRKATANRILTVLKAALNFAFRDEHAPSDKAWRRVQPFKDVDAARMRYLSQDECLRLVNSCEPDFRRLVQGALLTGARYGELGALRVADLNVDVGMLHIRSSKSGKGRHVVLTDDGQAFFADITAGRSGRDLIFKRPNGGAWGKAHQWRQLLEACERAGIGPPANFHALRHTYSSHLVMAGVPLQVVARNLGHADTRMVEKHYAHLAEDWVAEKIRSVAPSLGIKGKGKITPIRRRA